ncbi:MAG: phosphotransferase family protein [Gemmatimonadota bacterium]
MTQGDEPATVRRGEELDAGALRAYLGRALSTAADSIEISQFPHGHSNLTYLVRAGGTELVLRRPPFGNQVKTAHDMSREFRVLTALAPVFPPAPRPICLCTDESVLGAPFYLMERRHGIVVRKLVPEGLVLTPPLAERLGRALIATLAELHRLDYRAIGLGELGKPQGYVARQVKGWTDRYAAAKTEEVPEIESVARWLADHLPPEHEASVIHNDFKFDNLLLDPADSTRITAVLDWEMATVGDPLMDLGTSLGYWIHDDDPAELQAAALGPTMARGMLRREQVVEAYARASGRSVDHLVFYYAYGLFKLGVVVQQIYARYARGFTTDVRFATMNRMAGVLARQAERAIGAGRV